MSEMRLQADETMTDTRGDGPHGTALQDARSSHFDEDDPINFLFEEPTVTINFLRDAGLSEASCV